MDCTHHWLLGREENNLETGMVITQGICKLCGETKEFQAQSLDGVGMTAADLLVPDIEGVPAGFHLVEELALIKEEADDADSD